MSNVKQTQKNIYLLGWGMGFVYSNFCKGCKGCNFWPLAPYLNTFVDHCIDSEKKLKYVEEVEPKFFKNNILLAKSGVFYDTYLENDKIKLSKSAGIKVNNNETICNRFFMFKAKDPEDVEIKDNIEFSILASDFVARNGLIISKKDNEDIYPLQDTDKPSEQSNPLQQTNNPQENVSEHENSNSTDIENNVSSDIDIIEDNEEHLNEDNTNNEETVDVKIESNEETVVVKNDTKPENQSECKEDAKNEEETKPEKMFVETNDSLRFTTKIVCGVVLPLVCVCILICVFVFLKEETLKLKKYITPQSTRS